MTTTARNETNPTAPACGDSPTGAHHWIIGMPDSEMSGECKYCRTARTFRPFQEDIGFNKSPKKGAA